LAVRTIAYKMLVWFQRMDQKAIKGLTRQALHRRCISRSHKYGLLRLAVGQDLTRIVRSGLPRRIAPSAQVFAPRPDLKPPC